MNNISQWLLKTIIPVFIIIALPLLAIAQSGSPQRQSAIFESATVDVTDLAGNLIGDGHHSGEEHCINDNCNRKTQLQLGVRTFEYRFESLQAIDPGESRVVVAGSGVLISGNQRDKFEFTATIQDNGDGTLMVNYFASRPDASFIVPSSPGTFEVSG